MLAGKGAHILLKEAVDGCLLPSIGTGHIDGGIRSSRVACFLRFKVPQESRVCVGDFLQFKVLSRFSDYWVRRLLRFSFSVVPVPESEPTILDFKETGTHQKVEPRKNIFLLNQQN